MEKVKNMKILLLACLTKNKSGNAYGGAEKSIINLSNWLANHGHDVILASVEGDQQSFPIEKKVIFKGYNVQKKGKVFTHIQLFLNTQRAFLESKADVVIGFWIHPMFYLSLNPKSCKAIKIYSERNDPNFAYGKFSKLLRSFVMKSMSGVVFQTKDAMSYFDKQIQEKSEVIHNPVYINRNEYPVIEDSDNRIVSVGRLSAQKNYKLLINAFNKIKDEYKELKLEIYGEGPKRKELEDYIVLLNLEDRVKLMGAYPDVINRIYGARMFVLSSDYEGMPNALMEAMSIGIPVISSDCPCGGPRELISDGENGFLFECASLDSLVFKMREVLNSSDIIRIKKNEKAICDTHNSDMIFDKWEKFIIKLLQKNKRRN